jgi:hypothetical protein
VEKEINHLTFFAGHVRIRDQRPVHGIEGCHQRHFVLAQQSHEFEGNFILVYFFSEARVLV